jgi:general secretion pathway protein G
MTSTNLVKNEAGFTLIEMVGVLAVIAILAALVAPKIFEVIADSKATRMAAEARTYRDAVTKWYKDIGTLKSLVAAGTVTTPDTAFNTALTANGGTTATTGLWAKWHGPYIDGVKNIPIGTALTIETNAGVASVVAANATSWDLTDDGTADMATTNQVVAMKITGITQSEFDKVDAVIDSGFSTTSSANLSQGKVKYDSTNSIMYIYLAHN